jgi:hypothetical protein
MTGEAATPPPEAQVIADYEAWYRDRIGAEHGHAWWPIGCHFTGLATFACSPTLNLPHIQYLPDLPDAQLAMSVVGRFLETPTRDHARLQRDLLRAAAHRRASAPSLDGAMSFVPVFQAWLQGDPNER